MNTQLYRHWSGLLLLINQWHVWLIREDGTSLLQQNCSVESVRNNSELIGNNWKPLNNPKPKLNRDGYIVNNRGQIRKWNKQGHPI